MTAPLDEHYVLARVQFEWRFARASAPPIDEPVDSTFILFVNQGAHRIVFQQEREDFQQALRARAASYRPDLSSWFMRQSRRSAHEQPYTQSKGVGMVLLIVTALGACVGYRLRPGRRGFVTVALVSIGSAAVQIGHLFATGERSSMTMLPLVVGTILVASILAGALARQTSSNSSKAA